MAVVPQDAIAFSVKANALNNPHVATQTPSSPHQPAAEYPLQTFQRSNFVLCLFAAALAWPGWSQIQRGGWCWILAALLVLSFSFLLSQLSSVLARKDAHWRWLLFFTLNSKWFKGRTVAFFGLLMSSMHNSIHNIKADIKNKMFVVLCPTFQPTLP